MGRFNMSRYVSLKDKMENEDYVNALCYRSKGELKICKEMLTEEELRHYSSITTAYKVARIRYLEKYHPEYDIKDRPSVFVRYDMEP